MLMSINLRKKIAYFKIFLCKWVRLHEFGDFMGKGGIKFDIGCDMGLGIRKILFSKSGDRCYSTLPLNYS